MNKEAGTRAHVRARDLHAGLAGLAGGRSITRSSSSSPTRSRATRSATTPTRTSAKHPWRLDDEKLMYPAYELVREARHQERLRAQGTVPAVGRAAVPASARATATCATWARRRRTGRSSTSSSTTRAYRFAGGGTAEEALGAVRADRAHRVGHRPRRNSGEVRRHQRLRRPRPDLRAEHGGRAAALRGDDGHAGQGAGRRPRRAGARTRSGPARRSGRSRRCAGSRSPRTCRRNMASSRSAPADGPVKSAIFGGNNVRLYGLAEARRSWATGSPR